MSDDFEIKVFDMPVAPPEIVKDFKDFEKRIIWWQKEIVKACGIPAFCLRVPMPLTHPYDLEEE